MWPLSISVGAVARARQPTDQSPRLRSVDLHAGEVGMGGERRQVELPVVDLHPAVGEQDGHVGLALVLAIGPADTGQAHRGSHLGDHGGGGGVDRLQDSSGGVGDVHSADVRACVVRARPAEVGDRLAARG